MQARASRFYTLSRLVRGRDTVKRLLSDQERIGLALDAELAGLAVAANERNVIAKWQQFCFYRRNQCVVIAVRKVRAPNRARKQNVADEGEFLGAVEQHDRAWRMSRAMEYIETMSANFDLIALIEPAVWFDVARASDPVNLALSFEPLQQHAIGAVGTFDFDIEFGAQIFRAAGVIDVAVG